MFLKFLEEVQQLILSFEHMGWNRVDSAEVETEKKTLKIQT